MLTLYHAPMSRSSRIVTLIDELGALDDVAIQITDVPRRDGSGGPDPDNPIPSSKSPHWTTTEQPSPRASPSRYTSATSTRMPDCSLPRPALNAATLSAGWRGMRA